MKKIAKDIITIVCDDVRQEVDGKISIMGIYSDIIIPKIPIVLPKLNVIVLLRSINKIFTNIKTVLKDPTGKDYFFKSTPVPLSIEIGKSMNMDWGFAPFKVEKPGEFKWEIYFDDSEKPDHVHKFNIILSEPPKKEKK